ncbi:central glycolytic genes regulator [Pilibacter termitis]|uniref:Central glycolytic genes regulator n=1 Tax=Pilibacter termitis TaxID=263852 RepID=A0A1T4K1V9_9ENTE|nr:sugar-binding domain-containing protein [Pilibacter termitis]SJZ36267.1 central glycolytic genes regulator [Pilibacter termitis]
MQNEWKLLEYIAPDLLDKMNQRFRILRNIYWLAPIGRRNLCEKVGLTERVLRGETDFLKETGLITMNNSGMRLTEKGNEVYAELEKLLDSLFGMREIENRLAEHFGIQQAVVVAGDCDVQEKILEEFGANLSELLNDRLPTGENIIAVMGGSTIAKVAKNLTRLETDKRHNIFVPARGGIGEAVDVQANTVSAVMATKTHGTHRALYVPEQVKSDTYELLIQEPAIQEVLTLIRQSGCVIHSIGKAMYMARRRKMSEETLRLLKEKKAVAESFGYFFDEQGLLVYKMHRIGLQLEQLEKIPLIFAIAGGKSKAKVINAYMKNAPKQTILITDEACANEILKGFAPLK